jgi:hypothetical protein
VNDSPRGGWEKGLFSILVLSAWHIALAPACAAGADVAENGIMANATYVRESTDREWYVRIRGGIPSRCGAYLLVHDAAGAVIWHGVLPAGAYADDAPHELRIPADGRTGDYRLVLIGHQNDKLGLRTPLTDLPHEVYGGNYFTIGHGPGARVCLQVSGPDTKLWFAGYKGHLQVRGADGETVVGDTRERIRQERHDYTVDLDLKADTVYWVTPYQCFYFRIRHRDDADRPVFLAFDPTRWFQPDAGLQQVKWWQLLAPSTGANQ